MIIIYLVALIFGQSNQDYEQLAADHFFETIWKQDFAKYKSVEFDYKTDTTKYSSIYGCKQWNSDTKIKFDEVEPKGCVAIKVSKPDLSFKKRTKSERLKLYVRTKIQVGDSYVVAIEVYKPYQFVEHYFIKLDKDGKILDVCHFGEII